MKSLFVSFLAFTTYFLSGCGPTKSTLINTGYTGGTSLLSSECSSECKAAVSSQLGVTEIQSLNPYKRHFSFFGSPIVHRINGQPGETDFYGYGGAYNSSWDGSFTVEVPATQTNLDVRMDIHANPNKPFEKVQFSAVSGHTYFVGDYYWEDTIDHKFRWFPFVFDKTDNRVIYPKGKIGWSEGDAPGYQYPVIVPVIVK